MLGRIASLVNGLDADVILIAGIFFDELYSACGALRSGPRLSIHEKRLGIWACWGNHDMLYPSARKEPRF
jgi:predicted MPP superfamily phosphohydrolase